MERDRIRLAHRSSVFADISPSFLKTVQRAIVCATCTYSDTTHCERELKEFSTLGLRKVYLQAPCQGSVQNLVLAIAEDDGIKTLFVALHGTKSVSDWLTDLDTRQINYEYGLGFFKGSVQGKFHAGFCKQVSEQLPETRFIKGFMREKDISKLVFCGHSLGGALAHMALLKFVIRTRPPEESRHISISFGSPHICNPAANHYLGEQRLEERMFTFINESDPVPLLFNDFAKTRDLASRYLKKRTKAKFQMSSWFADTATVSLDEESRTTHQRTNVKVPAILHAFLNAIEDRNKGPLHYVPAGKYYELTRSGKILLVPQSLEILTRDLQITQETVACHKTGAYLQKLMKHASSIDCVETVARCSEVVKVCPDIQSCVMSFKGRHEEAWRATITIKGRHLQMPLSVKVLPESKLTWTVDSAEESTVVLKLAQEVSPDLMASLTERRNGRPAFSIDMKTCYGRPSPANVTVQDPWFDSCVKCEISRSLGKLLLMRRCRLASEYSINALDELRNAMDGFSLDEIASDDRRSLHRSIDRGWQRYLNPMVQGLMEPLSVPKITGWRQRALKPSCVAPAANYVKASYYDFLILVLEVLTDTKEQPGKEASFYERKIFCVLEEQRATVQSVNSGSSRSSSRSSDSAGWPDVVRATLLEKANVIYRVMKAGEILNQMKTVVFVGPQFVGKSTIINCLAGRKVAGRRAAEDSEEEERGQESVAVESFRMEADEKVVLVEMAGWVRGQQRWRDLEHVADLIVVIISFAGETTLAAEEWTKEARRGGDNFVMVVNEMDRVLHGPEHAQVWEDFDAEALKIRRRRYAKAAQLDPSDVLLSVTMGPTELDVGTLNKLQERGVLMCDQITAALHERIQLLHSHI